MLRIRNASIVKWKEAEHRETRGCGIAFCEGKNSSERLWYKWHRQWEYGITVHCPFQSGVEGYRMEQGHLGF